MMVPSRMPRRARRAATVVGVMVLTTLAPIKFVPPAMLVPSRGTVVLSATDTLVESGLLAVLVPMFEGRTGYRVTTLATTTRQALELGARGEATVVLAHTPGFERRYVEAGALLRPRPILYDELVIVGPAEDPAHVRGLRTPGEALRAI